MLCLNILPLSISSNVLHVSIEKIRAEICESLLKVCGFPSNTPFKPVASMYRV